MARIIHGAVFEHAGGRYRLPDPLEDVELVNCRFKFFQAPGQRELRDRPTLRRVSLNRCHFEANDLGPVIAEDCIVDRPWFHRGRWGPQDLDGCAFKHVTIRGNVTGSLRIRCLPFSEIHRRGGFRGATATAWFQANAKYYEKVDWALDISAARFTACEMWLSDIPARLVRRDPETQAVIKRERLVDERWADLDLPEPSIGIGLEWLFESGLPDTVLVASRRGRHFDAERRTIDLLRAEGIAELQ